LRLQFNHARLQGGGIPVQGRELPGRSLQSVSGLVGFIANSNGALEQVVLACLAFTKRFEVMDEGFFRLFLFTVKTEKTFAGFHGGTAERFDARFGLLNPTDARFGSRGEFLYVTAEDA
jgi:hypothetical protein